MAGIRGAVVVDRRSGRTSRLLAAPSRRLIHLDMQVNTCIMCGCDRRLGHGQGLQGARRSHPAATCWTGSTSTTGRRSASCASTSRWPASRRRSTSVVLEAANLVSTVRRGREKLHYLNPVPLHEIQERWIDKFERPRLRALSAVKRRAEEAMTDKPTFVYVIYIESTPGEGLARADRRRPDRRVLGPQQRVGLAGRLPLGAPAHGRLRTSPTSSARSWRACRRSGW